LRSNPKIAHKKHHTNINNTMDIILRRRKLYPTIYPINISQSNKAFIRDIEYLKSKIHCSLGIPKK
jgi:hypothetical protein